MYYIFSTYLTRIKIENKALNMEEVDSPQINFPPSPAPTLILETSDEEEQEISVLFFKRRKKIMKMIKIIKTKK